MFGSTAGRSRAEAVILPKTRVLVGIQVAKEIQISMAKKPTALEQELICHLAKKCRAYRQLTLVMGMEKLEEDITAWLVEHDLDPYTTWSAHWRSALILRAISASQAEGDRMAETGEGGGTEQKPS